MLGSQLLNVTKLSGIPPQVNRKKWSSLCRFTWHFTGDLPLPQSLKNISRIPVSSDVWRKATPAFSGICHRGDDMFRRVPRERTFSSLNSSKWRRKTQGVPERGHVGGPPSQARGPQRAQGAVRSPAWDSGMMKRSPRHDWRPLICLRLSSPDRSAGRSLLSQLSETRWRFRRWHFSPPVRGDMDVPISWTEGPRSQRDARPRIERDALLLHLLVTSSTRRLMTHGS